jgi:hypothetical protein
MYDSSLESCELFARTENLSIHIELWNGKKITIVFYGVIGFCCYSLSDPIGVRLSNDSDFFHHVIHKEFETIPTNHNYQCYELIDVDDSPFIKIVAQKIECLHSSEL